ncbi:cation diffusion facilitator family transporter [Candidatus Methylobacter oryzae]|uniref:Cation transporter n=1 Tax=Candidatus Methylobacter oryzae TaxID=2497749 RepID=A0ABY3C6M1_9GAMM|nr:cation diffusion facilitator family transporter [Candidatus Methylobacter oryzae]TRW91241.1 cation transporter [Candidatus Methylobacter oryzae]
MAKNHQHNHSHDHAGHSHSHGHRHHDHTHKQGRAFVLAIVLNSAFVLMEFSYGFIANSTALMADAGHNLSDILGLVLAWGASILSRRAPSERYTYGLRSTSIMAALANAMFLLVASGAIALEAVHRFSQPPAVAGLMVTWVATVGIVVNGLSAWLFVKGSKSDLNVRGAYLHMAADAAVSLGVVITGIAMVFTGWFWLDPVISLVIVAVIVVSTWELLRESVQLALIAVPAHIDVAALENYLRECPGVAGIHDLHIWGMSTTESALTVHLVMPDGYPGDAFIDAIVQTLKDRFLVHHCTLQVEQGTTNHSCALYPSITAGHIH